MVNIIGRKVESTPIEVFTKTASGIFAFPRKVDSLKTNTKIDPSQYVLVQTGDEANYALSAQRQLNGLAFEPMIRESFRLGQPLASVIDFTTHYRNVNLALQGNGILYDASGNLIEGERLIQVGNAINNAWIYLNNAYEKGEGFLGLNLVQATGLDSEGQLIASKQHLEEYVINCWADIHEGTNSQGYFIRKSPIQKFEKGRTIYQSRPAAGYVAGFYAGSYGAGLYCGRDPANRDDALGGILRADGVAQKISQEKK